MNNMMPDAISPMGRAVQAKTEGMTPDQVAALDQQYAKMGLMSINDVLTLKQQLDHMKQAGQQQQAGPPPTTTVAQDLQQQMGGGLASLPANVGKPSAYARGGIVAFPTGGFISEVSPGFGGYVDDAVKANPEVLNIFKTAETAAANAPPAARKAVLGRVLSGLARFPIKNPWVIAASIGLPLVANYLMGGDEEEAPDENTQAPPPEEPPVDLSGIMGEARQSGIGGGIASLGAGRGMPDVRGAYAPVLKSAQDNLAANQLQPRDEIAKTMDERYAGLTGHVDAREAALKEQQARFDASNEDKFWNSMAKGFFGMADAGGESGSTFWGAASKGALGGMDEYQRLTDKYEAEKTRLDDSMFGVGEARAAHKRGIIAATDTEENAQRSREDAARAQLLEIQAKQTDALLSAYDKMLDRSASMAIAMAREKGLTGLEMLQEASAIAGMRFGKNSPQYKQISALMEDVANRSIGAVLGARARSEGDLVPGVPGGEQGAWGNLRVNGQ